MAIQIGAVAKRNAQNNTQKIAASISSPPADSGASHMTKKAAKNVPRRWIYFLYSIRGNTNRSVLVLIRLHLTQGNPEVLGPRDPGGYRIVYYSKELELLETQ
jgi:hypothetical protein